MKKTGIINRDVSALVAQMGHTDALMISDAGFPIPHGVPCVDLSLAAGQPTVDEVVEMVAQELEVERFHVADEAAGVFADRTAEIQALLPNASAKQMSHTEMKVLVAGARGVIRTGDYRPYANVVLISGVPY